MLKVAFITLGCPKNEADTALMRAAIEVSAYENTNEIDAADVLVVNTCAFIQDATEESIETVLEAASIWLPKNKRRELLVAGCMVSRYGEKDLSEELPEVSGFLRVVDEHTLVPVIEKLTGVAAKITGEALRRAEASYAYIKISDGCHRDCAYCTIPRIRGDYKSKTIDEVVSEAKALLESGARELILIGQDTSEYGRDLPIDDLSGRKPNLVDLLKEIVSLEGLQRLRLMYLQPESVEDELIEFIAREDKIAKYIEMPLQHSNKEILRSMHRAGDAKSFLETVSKIRELIPNVALRTTLIVGYPGESDEDFEELYRFVEEAEFNYVGIFMFSPEEGTKAATLKNQIDEDIKLERYQELRDLADDIGWNKTSNLIDTIQEVIIEGRDEEGRIFGRTQFSAPDIDGIVRINESTKELEVGQMVKVKITDSILYDLEGDVL